MSNATALLVIDIQLGLFQLPIPMFNAGQLLANINTLIGRARANGVPVIFIQHNGKGDSPMRPDRPGWALHPAIVPREGEPVVVKDQPNAFQGTPLQQLLQEMSIQKLVVAGVVSDGCVQATWQDALQLGYQVTLVADAHSIDEDELEAREIIEQVNRAIEAAGGQVKPTAQVVFV